MFSKKTRPSRTSCRCWRTNYLAAPSRGSEFILTSPKGGAYRKTSVTNLVCPVTGELGFKGH